MTSSMQSELVSTVISTSRPRRWPSTSSDRSSGMKYAASTSSVCLVDSASERIAGLSSKAHLPHPCPACHRQLVPYPNASVPASCPALQPDTSGMQMNKALERSPWQAGPPQSPVPSAYIRRLDSRKGASLRTGTASRLSQIRWKLALISGTTAPNASKSMSRKFPHS